MKVSRVKQAHFPESLAVEFEVIRVPDAFDLGKEVHMVDCREFVPKHVELRHHTHASADVFHVLAKLQLKKTRIARRQLDVAA